MKQREIKFRAWIKSNKEQWLGADNFNTFNWDNRMRKVDSIYFPLNKPSGKDIICKPIYKDDNYANMWFAKKDLILNIKLRLNWNYLTIRVHTTSCHIHSAAVAHINVIFVWRII